MNLTHKAVRLEIKEASEQGEFSGYASVFDIEDFDGEAIAPGAFAASLAEHEANGTQPALLWQHKVAEPIGKWLSLKEDEKGLRAKGKLLVDAIQRAKEVFTLLKEKAVNGLSIGFIPRKYEIDEEAWLDPSLGPALTHTEVSLLEVSIVTLPANPQARIDGVKGLANVARAVLSGVRRYIDNPRAFERFLRDAGFSQTQAKTITGHGFRASQCDVAEDSNNGKQRDAVSDYIKQHIVRYIHDCGDSIRGKAAR